MVYCTRKISRAKYNKHKEITFLSLKYYSVDVYKEALEKVSIPNYDSFDNLDPAYSDFINRLESVIDVVVLVKTVRIKSSTREWFDGEIAEEIYERNKLHKKFKLTKLHVDEDLHKEARNAVQNLIRKKKEAYFEEKLKANTANPKKLWEILKELCLQNNRSPSSDICLKNKDGLTFDPFTISEVFQKFYYNLASNLVDKHPAAVNKFGLHSVEVYYKNVLQLQENKFIFHTIDSNSVLQLLKNVKVNKAAGIDNISGQFLKDGADILAIPVTQICNLSIKLSHLPNDCKLAKLKPLYKKGSKTDPKSYRRISVLPIVSKVIEEIIHDQTMEYLTDNKILCRYQSGFRKNHSTDTCHSYMTDKILTGFDFEL